MKLLNMVDQYGIEILGPDVMPVKGNTHKAGKAAAKATSASAG